MKLNFLKIGTHFSILFLTLFLSLIFPQSALADTFTLSGHVQNSSGDATSGATVDVKDSSTNTVIAGTSTNSSGDYSLSINEGTYNVQITPLSGSGYSSAIAVNQVISSNKTLNFILTPLGTVVMSGYLHDPLGNVLPNQNIRLDSGSTTVASTTTDNNGYYSLSVAPGTYNLFISFVDTNNIYNTARNYTIRVNDFILSQSNENQNLTIPFKKVDVHVQNSAGQSLQEVQLTTNNPGGVNDLNIGAGITTATGFSFYGSPGKNTDSSGNVTLWLFSNNYSLTATPPNGSSYSITSSSSNIASDTNLTITMQQPVIFSGYLHDALGNALPNQNVRLDSGSTTVAATTTDNNGFYSLSVAPGTYNLFISYVDTNDLYNVARNYTIRVDNYILSQNVENQNLTIPFKKVDIHVQNAAGQPINDMPLTTNNPGGVNDLDIGGGITTATGFSFYGSPGKNTDNSGNATLWVFTNNYAVTATPPNGSEYSTTSVTKNVAADTNLSITMQQPVVFSGYLHDALGNILPNQNVTLSSNGTTVASTTTDSAGFYSLSVSAATYDLFISYVDTNNLYNIARNYSIRVNGFSLTQNTTNLNLTLPMKKIDVHVQNPLGQPVSGVQLTTNNPGGVNDLDIGGGITTATGFSFYGTPGITTDASGNATIWLFPNTYSFIATPQQGSIYNIFTLNNINVTGNQTEIVSLQYNHAAPVTTATLATQHVDETYSNPTTVTLSATAASGYSVANTYYKVDGGSQQTYSAPFAVLGNGGHTIEYWSVDNSGVPETHKTKTFTIYVNQAPHVDPFSGGSINVGGTFTASSSFTDADSTSWTATVDYGDGAGEEALNLNPDKTFSLSHQYATAGTYTVTVVVRDDAQATGTTMATVTVNAAPQISGLSDTEINFQDDFIETGSFTDNDSVSWTATVDYGDGFGIQPLTLNADHSFTLNRMYTAAGVYNATVTVTDNQGATATANVTVKVNTPPYISQLLGAEINEGQPYTENGLFSDTDSTSWTGTVNYGDGSGVQALTLNPDNTFSLSHLYTDNGTYTTIVTIVDNQGAIGTRTATVTVNNVAPTVSQITASINPIQVNTSTTVAATFTDPGVLDTHTAVWNWGDGTTSNATINAGSVSDSHTYTTAGVYTISLTVTDNDGGVTAQTFQYLSVYNPTSQGLFSAGQRFTSPAGAYVQNPNLTGNILFGLSYKYQGTIPTGNRQFSVDFNQANFHFNATAVSSLVINNGIGILTGTGTINGAGTYNYLVAGSESANTIRIQIKDQSGSVVYDTQPGDAATATPTTVVTGNVLAH